MPPVVKAKIPDGTHARRDESASSRSSGRVTGRENKGFADAVSDGSSRSQAPMPKAWTTGVNPLTQRVNKSPQNNDSSSVKSKHNGAATDSQSKGEVSRKTMTADKMSALLANSVGLYAVVTLSSGERYRGLFFGTTTKPGKAAAPAICSYHMKMVQKQDSVPRQRADLSSPSRHEFVGSGDDYSMVFEASNVHDLAIEGLTSASVDQKTNGTNQGFQTDTAISGNRLGQERELKAWQPPSDDSHDQSLESDTKAVTSGAWDQFKANETLFGVKSDYDENLYTTRIDTSHPQFREREVAATQLARKMGDGKLQGEKNETGDWDEEDKYSGVRRESASAYPPLQSSQPGKYQPPARRPPTGKPTIPGAPVDPAIISSHLVQPNISTPQQTTASTSNDHAHTQRVDKSSTAQKPVVVESKKPQITLPTTNQSVATNARAPSTNTTSPLAPMSATKNVEHKVLSSFKQFSEKEKIRVADDRRQRVIHDKTVKLNDLRSFSKNFSLNTPIPSDLVPILAKDKKKQDELLEKAQRNAQQQQRSKLSDDQAKKVKDELAPTVKSPRASPGPIAQLDVASNQALRERPIPVPVSQQSVMPGRDQGLAQRLAKVQRDRQAGIVVPIPAPLPINSAHRSASRTSVAKRQGSAQSSSHDRSSPLSAGVSTKLNVKAVEFIPNPRAAAFAPTPVSSTGPKSTAASPIPAQTSRQETKSDKARNDVSTKNSEAKADTSPKQSLSKGSSDGPKSIREPPQKESRSDVNSAATKETTTSSEQTDARPATSSSAVNAPSPSDSQQHDAGHSQSQSPATTMAMANPPQMYMGMPQPGMMLPHTPGAGGDQQQQHQQQQQQRMLSSSQSMMMYPPSGRMPTGFAPYAMGPNGVPVPLPLPAHFGYPPPNMAGMPAFPTGPGGMLMHSPGAPMAPHPSQQFRAYGYMPHFNPHSQYGGQMQQGPTPGAPGMTAPMMTPQGSQGSYFGSPNGMPMPMPMPVPMAGYHPASTGGMPVYNNGGYSNSPGRSGGGSRSMMPQGPPPHVYMNGATNANPGAYSSPRTAPVSTKAERGT